MRTFTLPAVVIFLTLLALSRFLYTGIFLMMFGGAPTGLALIAVFVCIVIDCWRGVMPKFLLIVPATALAGYYVLYFTQAIEIARYERELKSSNPTQLIDFDPRRQHSLVVSQSTSLPGHYQIPVVYQGNENTKGQKHWAHRAQFGSTCETRPNSQRLERWVSRVQVRSPSTGRSVLVRGICVIRTPERPRGEIIAVRITDQRIWDYRTSIMEGSYTLLRAGEELGTFRTASVRRLLPYPFPLIGCGLNSAAPSWDCFAVLGRQLYRLDAAPNDHDDPSVKHPLAIMLGLQPRQFEGL